MTSFGEGSRRSTREACSSSSRSWRPRSAFRSKEPETGRELQAEAGQTPRRARPQGEEHAPGAALGGPRAYESPREPRELKRDPELHDGQQDRVEVRRRITRRPDVPAEVHPVDEAAADELGREREQREGGASPKR